VAFISGLGVLAASIAVAYSFSRFRIPGAKWLFYLLIATILISDSITLVPTHFMYVRVLDWNGPQYPLVALLHFFYTWNELRVASLYLGIAPDLRTVSYSIQTIQLLSPSPAVLQAGALLAMAVPVLVLFLFQRFFMQDMVVTGTEK
jgi:ABC-type glycerol-3-phosphate transport system permease component